MDFSAHWILNSLSFIIMLLLLMKNPHTATGVIEVCSFSIFMEIDSRKQQNSKNKEMNKPNGC